MDGHRSIVYAVSYPQATIPSFYAVWHAGIMGTAYRRLQGRCKAAGLPTNRSAAELTELLAKAARTQAPSTSSAEVVSPPPARRQQQQQQPRKARRSRWRKLFTHQDVLLGLAHVHKALGVAVLGHICMRLVYGIDISTDADVHVMTGWMLAHLALAASAFEFRVPARSTVHVLDALYRAQVLCFSLRSVLVILVALWEPPRAPILALLSVMACHAAADWCGGHYPDNGGGVRRAMLRGDFKGVAERTTPGGLLSSSTTVKGGRLFFAVAQCNATSQMIFSDNVAYTVVGAFYTMAVIQITAFLMTLRKKGFIEPVHWKVLYTLMLAGVAVQMVAIADVGELLFISALSLLYAGLRLFAGFNKYLLMVFIFTFSRVIHYEDEVGVMFTFKELFV